MPDQPRPDRKRRSRFVIALAFLTSLTLAAMLAGGVFGSTSRAGADSHDSAGGTDAVNSSGGAARAVDKLSANQPGQSGQLAVQYTFPAQNDVEVDAQATVLVQFNRPVSALTALAQRNNQPVLVFDPPATGSGHWLTSSLYVFRPDALQPDTHYSVRVLQQLSDLPDGQLPQEYIFGFDTIVPAVADMAPRDNTQYVDPTAPLQVLFNQPVDQATAESLFSLSDGSNTVAGAFSWPDDHTMVFQPAAPLARGVHYTASAAGAAAPAKVTTWGFTVVDFPRVTSTDPANGDTSARLGGVSITFSAPMDHDSTEAAITFDPPPDPDNAPDFFWSGSDTVLNINLHTEYLSSYRASIGAGAHDRYDTPIQAPYSLSFTTQAPSTPQPGLSILAGQAGVLSAYAPAQVFVGSVNVQNIDLTLSPLAEAEFRTLLTTDYQTYRTFKPSGAALRQWSVPVAGYQQDQQETTPIDLGTQTLPDGGTLAPGYYLLDASANGVTYQDRVALEITKTNLVVKRGVDSGLVWAVDLNTGQPVAGATVTLYDRSGAALASGQTAADGTFAAPLPRPDYSQNPPQLYAALDRPDDAAIASQDWTGTATQPYSKDFPVSLYPQVQQKGYLYTDRPIYRAGETVHLRFVLRTDDDGRYSIPSFGALTLETRDSRGNTVDTQQVQLDGYGSLGADVKLPDDAATGNYSFTLHRNNDQLGYGGFLVAQFRVPEFEVKLDTDSGDYISGQTINATVSADLFLGAPLAGGAVDYQVNAAPYLFHPSDKAYDGYGFNDFELINRNGAGPSPSPVPSASPVAKGAATTDSQGNTTIMVPAQLGSYPASERYTITGTVTDLSRQQVSASKEVIVHRAAEYAGVKPEQYLGQAGQPETIDVVSVDTKGKAAPGVSLQATVYRRVWKTTKGKNPDGSPRYINTPQDTQVAAQMLTTDAAGKASFSFTPAQGGQYRVTIAGQDAAGNTFQTATSLYVTSGDFLPWRVDNQDGLTLVADKDTYAPGDVAHVLVPAPFAGAVGLVTVERGRINSYNTRQFPTNSTVIDVPITADMAPTVYLGVALLKPGQVSSDVGGYRAGYAQLKVDPSLHKLNITLTPDRTTLGPGDTVNVTVKATDGSGKGVASELSLAMVDKAVLSLADDRTQAIFPSFWSTRPLGVGTGSSQGQSLNAVNAAAQKQVRAATPPPPPTAAARPAIAATAAAGAAPGSAAPAVRSDFQNTAYWTANVTTDAGGNATVSIKLPDNLTTWQIAARGITVDTSVGDALTSIETRRDLVLRPVAPRFFTAGDSAHLEALLTNRTNAPLSVTVNLTAENLAITGGPQQITVPPGQSVSAGWDTTAPDSAGPPVKLTFTAQATSGQADGVELTLPVNERLTPETVASSGIVQDQDVTENVVVPGFARQDKGSLSVEISASLAAVAKRAAFYLEAWLYEPNDVTAARLLDRVAAWQTAVKLQKPQSEQDDAKGTAAKAIARLVANQRFDGGWLWWGDPYISGPSSPDVTAQVLYALGVANRAGLPVSDGVRGGAARFLTGAYDRSADVNRPPDPNTQAFWLLALAEAGYGSRDREDQLAGQRSLLGGSGHGALLAALLLDGAQPDDPEVRGLAGDLESTAIASASGTHWEDTDPNHPDYANSTRATALTLRSLLALDPTQPLLDGAVRWLSGARRDGYWRSVRETGLAVDAIGAFVVAREQPIDGLSFSVTVNGQPVGSGTIAPEQASDTQTVQTGLGGLPRDTPLPVDIHKDGSGQLYYSLFMRYFSQTDQVTALSNGVTIAREVLPADSDTPVDTVKAGDLVRVRLTIAAPSDLEFVQVEDYLPAGLEAVDASLKTTDPNLVAQQQQELNQLLQLPVNRSGGTSGSAIVPGRYRYVFNPFNHVEVRDDRVALFATSLSRGVHEYVYYARATTPGMFLFPPVVAEETTFPDIFGRSDSGTLTVTP